MCSICLCGCKIFIILKKIYEYQSEIKATLNLGTPIVVGQLGIMAMGVADTIQVGLIPERGTVSVSAAGVAIGLFITIAIIGMVALSVVAPMISKAKAEDNLAECNRLFRAANCVALSMGIISAGLIMVLAYFLEILNQEPEVTRLAQPFCYLIALSVIPQFIFIAFRQLSDGLGKTHYAMFMTVSALILNIFLNWLLIYGHWRFPKLELIGSGIATLISRIYMMLGLALIVFGKTFFKWSASLA